MYPGCKKRFHPICGLTARPQLYIRHDDDEDYVALCENHHPIRSMSKENLRVVGRVLQKQLDDARNLVSLVMRREKQKRNLVHLQMPLWIKELEEDGVANKKEIEQMARILLPEEGEEKEESKEKSSKAKKREKKIRKRALESTRLCTFFFYFDHVFFISISSLELLLKLQGQLEHAEQR